MNDRSSWDVVIIGGGFAGLPAGIYLGRSRRRVLVIEWGKSMAVWEPDVQNYLGFPEGISGEDLLAKGRAQALKFGVTLVQDNIRHLSKQDDLFHIEGTKSYRSKRVLLATGLTHLPPDIPGVSDCLGYSLFFCKDCDAFRVQDKRIVVIGRNDEAVDYALAMLSYSPSVIIATNGNDPKWNEVHAAWLEEYQVGIERQRIVHIEQEDGAIQGFIFEQGHRISADAAFTTRGDVYHTSLAKGIGAALDDDGQVMVDACMRTNVAGLYAAGCVTVAICQMMIAAGQGVTAAQAINRDLFEDSLRRHALPVRRRPFEETACPMPIGEEP